MTEDRHDAPLIPEAPPPDADRLQRELVALAAEFDNYRKSVARERELLRERALDEAALALLPVYDALRLGLADPGTGEALRETLSRLQGLVEESLRRLGCEGYDAVNAAFDPLYHDAVLAEESDLEKNVILAELARGFMRNGRVLRPAKVKVSLGRRGGGEA